MTFNQPDTTLKELIYVCKGIIPENVCDYIVEETDKREWTSHTWYNSVERTATSEKTKELEVQAISVELQELLTPFMISAAAEYNSKCYFESEKTMQIMHKFTPIRFNRYSPGQIMRQHYDHIHLGGNEEQRGIPIVSFIGNLNDDYEGADLYFWKDYVVPLGKGDIILFPSLFLFPHGVTEATSGVRRSFVSWAF